MKNSLLRLLDFIRQQLVPQLELIPVRRVKVKPSDLHVRNSNQDQSKKPF